MLKLLWPMSSWLSDPKINFLKYHKIALAFSVILIILSFVSMFTRGFNFGIDFAGGILLEVRMEDGVDMAKLRSVLSNEKFGEVNLQDFGDKDVMIRISQPKNSGENVEESDSQTETIASVKKILRANFGSNITYRKIDYVGPQVGSELVIKGLSALLIAFASIMVYIWIRFEWQFGIGAVLALIHDAILTLGLFSVVGLEFNLTSVAAILTIVGYSINDSVVIYDRIRENFRKFKTMEIGDVINLSLNATLSRTVLTAGSTIAVLVALVLLGGEALKSFSIAVLFGVVIGTYSSIYISAPVLIYMNLKRVDKKK